MNRVKYNPFSVFKPVGIDQFLDEVSGRSISDLFENNFVNVSPSVNIKEDDEGYTIELAAPGIPKEDFSIEINDKSLIIKTDKKEGEIDTTGKTLRKEFNYEVFKRSFFLSDDISQESVTASFDNGILSVRLLKKEDAKPVNKTIKVS